jgi:hypothetical protein
MLDTLKPPAWSPPVPTMSIAALAQPPRPGSMARARNALAKAAT